MVNVGQGDCTVVVDGPTKQALLIDCNSHFDLNAVAALNRLRFSELSAAVVTHSHLDHFGGVLDVPSRLEDRFTGVLYVNHDTILAMGGTGADEPRAKTEYNGARQRRRTQFACPPKRQLLRRCQAASQISDVHAGDTDVYRNPDGGALCGIDHRRARHWERSDSHSRSGQPCPVRSDAGEPTVRLMQVCRRVP